VTEQQLVNRFVRSLRKKQSPWGIVKVSLEFDYQRGRPDILAVTEDGHLIAFEASSRNGERPCTKHTEIPALRIPRTSYCLKRLR
jgi:hypothetical protein